jgi:hypothetical protein
MGSMKLTQGSSLIFHRLAGVQMSAAERARAEAMMQQAEAFAEALVCIQAGVHAAALSIGRMFGSLRGRGRSSLSRVEHR